MLSPAERTLVPLVLAMYHLLCQKMYGDALDGYEYEQKREKAAKMLHECYTKHAVGAPLMVPPEVQILSLSQELLSDSKSKWEAMQWYRDLPTSQQPLQERDANAGTATHAPDDSEKKRGTKRSSPVSSDKDHSKSKAAKKDENHVYTADELADIHLEGEETEETPIFDTCSDIRRKMNDALKHTTQANLARQLDSIVPRSSVNAKQVRKFLDFNGVQGGAHSIAFYAGSVYFEKIRLIEGKGKGKKREKTEEIWAGPRQETRFVSWHSKGSRLRGFPRQGEHKAAMSLPEGDNWKMDQYGQVVVHRQDGSVRVD